jgi:hypothetical protein
LAIPRIGERTLTMVKVISGSPEYSN